MREEHRLVIGAFKIGEVVDVEGESVVIASTEGPHLKVTDFSKAPTFWDFHRQAAGPKWGAGLFRYISDSEAAALLGALEAVAVDVR